MGVVDVGGESSFAADELRRTSGVFDGSVVCETLLNCAVKGSRKVGGRRRESRQQARLAARERNMLCGAAGSINCNGLCLTNDQKIIMPRLLSLARPQMQVQMAGPSPLAPSSPQKPIHLFLARSQTLPPTHFKPPHIINRRHASE